MIENHDLKQLILANRQPLDNEVTTLTTIPSGHQLIKLCLSLLGIPQP